MAQQLQEHVRAAIKFRAEIIGLKEDLAKAIAERDQALAQLKKQGI